VSGEVIGLFQPGDKVRAKMRSYTGKGPRVVSRSRRPEVEVISGGYAAGNS